MNNDLASDRRFFPRLHNKLNLKYKIVKSPQKILSEQPPSEQFSILKNISAGGILFVVFQQLPIGTILDINFELLDREEPITCLVKVVRIERIGKDKSYEIGACFLDLSAKDRTRLLKYVKGEW